MSSYSDVTFNYPPSATIPIARLAKFVFLTSALPTARSTLGGFHLEELVTKAYNDDMFTAIRNPGYPSVDVTIDTRVHKYLTQIKSMKGEKKSIVWRRFGVQNKLERIQLSKVCPDTLRQLGTELLEKFCDGFNTEENSSFIYMQFMDMKTEMKLLVSCIDQNRLATYLNSEVEWSWSQPNASGHTSLIGKIDGITMFCWCGLSGNHFMIMDLPEFLKKVSSSRIGYRLPLRQEPLSIEALDASISHLLT